MNQSELNKLLKYSQTKVDSTKGWGSIMPEELIVEKHIMGVVPSNRILLGISQFRHPADI